MNRAVNNEVNINSGKSAAALFAEMKQELQDFVQTRVTMFKVELQEKVRVVKAAAPLAVIGAVLLLTAYLLLTLALVALVFALLPDNAYRHPSMHNVRVLLERVGTDALRDELALIFGDV